MNKRVSFAFFNCTKCKIEIVGKCQNVSIQSCKNSEIHIDQVVSQVEMFKCQALKVYAIKQLPMANIEGCNQVNIYLTYDTLKTKISTSCTRSTIINWPKADMTPEQLQETANWFMEAVPEVYTTTVAGNTLDTQGYKEDD